MEEYLYKFNQYLPIDDIEVSEYFNKLGTVISNNYEKCEYQFAYLGLHMAFMTYLYFTVWQISKMNKKEYELTIMFARPYKSNDLSLDEIKSIFDFRFLPEKDVTNYLYLIGIDKSYLKILKNQIEARNNMAHACGFFSIIDKYSFDNETSNIISIIEKCNYHICNNLIIKEYFTSLISTFSDDDFIDDCKINNFIDSNLIEDLSFSIEELRFISSVGKNKIFRTLKILNIIPNEKIKNLHHLVQKNCRKRV